MTPATTTAARAEPAPVFALVPFRDTEILAARVGDEVRVPMRRFCGSVGLPWDGQRQRIDRDEVLREGASMMLVPSEGGEQQQMTLPLDLIPGFLFGAEPRRFAPELRDRVRAFRRECFSALHAHFFRAPPAAPVVSRPPAVPSWQELDAARRAAPALIAAITGERSRSARRYLHQLLIADCARLGLTAPLLDELGEDGDTAEEAIARMIDGLEVLTARRVKWNHLGTRAGVRMAIVPGEVERLLARADIDAEVDVGRLRSCCGWRVTRRRIMSAITHRPVLAVHLEPWPAGAPL